MESGSPRGLPFHPGVIKAFQGTPGAFGDRPTGKFARSDADKCTSSVLCATAGYVSTAGINSRQKAREEERGRTYGRSVRYHYPVRHPHPVFSLKTSSVQAVRLENLHPRDVSSLKPVSSLKLGIRTATNSMTNEKIFTNPIGENTGRRIAMNIK